MIPTSVCNELKEKFSAQTAEILISLIENNYATKEDTRAVVEKLQAATAVVKDVRALLTRATWLLGILLVLAVVIIKFT